MCYISRKPGRICEQWVSFIGKQAAQNTDPQRKENEPEEPYRCFNSQQGESFQHADQGGETQKSPGRLTELRDRVQSYGKNLQDIVPERRLMHK